MVGGGARLLIGLSGDSCVDQSDYSRTEGNGCQCQTHLNPSRIAVLRYTVGQTSPITTHSLDSR